MSKKKYLKTLNQLTDYNYSFCDESQIISNKENIPYNSNKSLHGKIDELQKIINKQCNFINKNNAVMQEQNEKIQQLRKQIQNIYQYINIEHRQTTLQTINFTQPSHSLHENTIINYPNIIQYKSKQLSKTKLQIKKNKKNIESSKQSERSFGQSIRSEKNNFKKSYGKQSRQYSMNYCERTSKNSNEQQTNQLLTSIIQRKLNIQKELKERLSNHLSSNKHKTRYQPTNHKNVYLTYETQQ